MTFRDDSDALRARLEVAEAENERLRDEVTRANEANEALRRRAKTVTTEQTAQALAEEQRAEVRRIRWRDRLSALKRAAGYMLGALIGGGVITGVILGAFAARRYGENVRQAQRDAEVARLNALRARVPNGIDPRTWSWCVDHCIRWGQPGTSRTYEGVVSDVFIDYADGTASTTRATIRGPWLNDSGATVISTSFDTGEALQRGDLVVVHMTQGDIFITQRRAP